MIYQVLSPMDGRLLVCHLPDTTQWHKGAVIKQTQ